MEASELDSIVSEFRTLEPGAQQRLTMALAEMVAQAKQESGHDSAMRDADYRSYIHSALAEAEADRVAGRVEPMETALNGMESDFKAKHGL